ncbi:hypothetical protein HCY58_03465 [Acinetobacter radioresistens]|uniref:endonuclease domain-containing protein n=1 Tax=Acinetobacter radioresistens TaxID=40216 RepID=UPI00200428BA|nr:endonuclease domain-containing protein [Acinetobacter radioresistens]MCK4086123.1 hypothetical protein [Acinetobacter radioresistens]
MDADQYKALTKKKPLKKVPRAKPLPKATQKYLEAEETLFQELEEHSIGYERKFQFKNTKHWRFDFHIVKLRLLIEIEGGPWSGGRRGKLANKAWSIDRYDHAEELGYTFERFHPDSILSGYVINWIKKELERMNDRTVQTIPTVGSD